MNKRTYIIEEAINGDGEFGKYCFVNKKVLRQGLSQFKNSFNMYRVELEEDDIAQEILIVAIKCFNNIGKVKTRDGYLMTSIENKRIDWIKYWTAEKRKYILVTEYDDNITPSNNNDQRENKMDLLKAISKLTSAESYLVIQHIFMERTFEELSKELGCHKNTVYNRVKKIKVKVKELLMEEV